MNLLNIEKDGNISVKTNSKYKRLESFDQSKLCSNFTPPSNDPTPVQKYTIPIIKNKNSVLVRAPTGMGKTLCFLLPLIDNLKKLYKPLLRIVVVSPTRELCDQIKNQADEILNQSDNTISPWCVKIESVFSNNNFKGNNFKKNNINKYKNLSVESVYGKKKELISYNFDIIIATPGRLLDLLKRNKINFNNLESFVLDEADKLLDMGFENDIRKIYSFIPNPLYSDYTNIYDTSNILNVSNISNTNNISNINKTQICLFSATYNKNLTSIINDFLGINRFIVEVENEVTENISQELIKTNNKDLLLAEILSKQDFSTSWKNNKIPDKVLIFVEKKITAMELEKRINSGKLLKKYISNTNNINNTNIWLANSIHGDKDQELRSLAIKKFRENRIQILIATSVAARGIDIKDIGTVINYDFPKESKEYIHRIGRTGRSGKKGISISFIENGDLILTSENLKQSIIDILKESKNTIPDFLLNSNNKKNNYNKQNKIINKKSLTNSFSKLSIKSNTSNDNKKFIKNKSFSIDDSDEVEKEDSDGDSKIIW